MESTPRSDGRARLHWTLRGARGVAGVPALVLMSAMVGFAGLAREMELTLGETVFMTFGVWALPSMIVLVGGIGSGLGLVPVALAVALASVRFTPMTMALVPEMRAERTRSTTLYVLAHFIAITAWVHAQRNLPGVPREHRTAFFGGFAVTLTSVSTCIVAWVHQASATLPAVAGAMLVFLTPIYFLTALWSSARLASDRAALLLGLVLGPVLAALVPSLGIVAAGLVGGTIAYFGWRPK